MEWTSDTTKIENIMVFQQGQEERKIVEIYREFNKLQQRWGKQKGKTLGSFVRVS